MAIEQGQPILASDVVEELYATKDEPRFQITGKIFSGVSGTATYYYKLPPGQKFVGDPYFFDKSKGGLNLTYSTKNVDDEDWTVGGTYEDVRVTLLNETRNFKDVRVEVYSDMPSSSGGVTNRLDFRGESYIMPEIASVGENVRVMDETYNNWLTVGTTKVTVALYNAGRLGYA